MATINFYVSVGSAFDVDLAGSGLGFYGAGGFGASVAVGAYQDNTYVTGSGGLEEGPHGYNVKWVHANSGEVAGSTILNLQRIPNYEASLNIRFSTTGTPVNVQNAELRIYDRSDITKGASGVVTKVAELVNIALTEGVLGSGDTAWHTPVGSSDPVDLRDNPGISGTAVVGGTGTSLTHDWYVAISASPSSIGSKTQYGLYVSLEYL